MEHLALALEGTSRLRVLDISENDIGPQNFKIIMKIFHKNNQIELLNVADCKVIPKSNIYV